MKVLFVVPYPIGEAPSQRFRFEHYLPDLDKNGIDYDLASFWDEKGWAVLYAKGKKIQKGIALCNSFFRRWKLMFGLKSYDRVFIHREASPIGPPVFEWWITHIAQKKVIYDFDDAIWLPDAPDNWKLKDWIKNPAKVRKIICWVNKCIVGNDYLKEFASYYCRQVTVIPTVVDTNRHVPHVKPTHPYKTKMIWTGSHSTLKYLLPIIPVLKELSKKYSIELMVVSNRDPKIREPFVHFIKWQKETEIEQLQDADIGIMPLPENEWTLGKCGFKAIQYLSVGIPAVVSPVGVNTKIVVHKENGYIAKNDDEWYSYLQLLIRNKVSRRKLGDSGRKHIQKYYSVAATRSLFIAKIKA